MLFMLSRTLSGSHEGNTEWNSKQVLNRFSDSLRILWRQLERYREVHYRN